MSLPEQSIQIFAIGMPKKGTPRDKRRYRVKWRVDGHDKTRSKKTKAEAERLHSRLQAAVINGEEFDMASGLPVSWVQPIETWWTWSQGWLALKFPDIFRVALWRPLVLGNTYTAPNPTSKIDHIFAREVSSHVDREIDCEVQDHHGDHCYVGGNIHFRNSDE